MRSSSVWVSVIGLYIPRQEASRALQVAWTIRKLLFSVLALAALALTAPVPAGAQEAARDPSSFDATKAHASVEFTSPTTTTQSGRRAWSTGSKRRKFMLVGPPWVLKTTGGS